MAGAGVNQAAGRQLAIAGLESKTDDMREPSAH
jgi:hypothetical protein